jgi:hypothetical protein
LRLLTAVKPLALHGRYDFINFYHGISICNYCQTIVGVCNLFYLLTLYQVEPC